MIGAIILTIIACTKDDNFDFKVEIPDFNFPKTIDFEQSLLSYDIFKGLPSELVPSDDFHLLELGSMLFTDYAYKQRLVKIPSGSQMIRENDGSIDFPDGTILTKTFFYQNDEREPSLGKRIIETRLEIKKNGHWNIATYLWNQEQTDANLLLDGYDIQVNWIRTDGSNRSTSYHVPSQNECMTCHQSNLAISPIGPSLRNLNRNVERNGGSVNQLSYLQAIGILNDFDIGQVPQIVDYQDSSISLSERGRAYLDMNCAHCHNPSGWDFATERQFDFRYETSLVRTGILFEEEKITNALLDREMPFIGTTLLDQEGVNLVMKYLKSL